MKSATVRQVPHSAYHVMTNFKTNTTDYTYQYDSLLHIE